MSTNSDNLVPVLRSRTHINAAVRLIVACTVALAALTGVGLPQVQLAAAAPSVQTGPVTWTVLVGGQGEMEQQPMGPMGAWQFMRFYPDSITVNVGDTIVWKYNAAEPHTVTFPKSGDQVPVLAIPEGGSSQRMLFNPPAILAQGGASYDGTALAGSGQMGGGPQFPTEYKLTFTRPGTYDYSCAFHTLIDEGQGHRPSGWHGLSQDASAD
jgi:plastocyanin